jgi:hypothetical protein
LILHEEELDTKSPSFMTNDLCTYVIGKIVLEHRASNVSVAPEQAHCPSLNKPPTCEHTTVIVKSGGADCTVCAEFFSKQEDRMVAWALAPT